MLAIQLFILIVSSLFGLSFQSQKCPNIIYDTVKLFIFSTFLIKNFWILIGLFLFIWLRELIKKFDTEKKIELPNIQQNIIQSQKGKLSSFSLEAIESAVEAVQIYDHVTRESQYAILQRTDKSHLAQLGITLKNTVLLEKGRLADSNQASKLQYQIKGFSQKGQIKIQNSILFNKQNRLYILLNKIVLFDDFYKISIIICQTPKEVQLILIIKIQQLLFIKIHLLIYLYYIKTSLSYKFIQNFQEIICAIAIISQIDNQKKGNGAQQISIKYEDNSEYLRNQNRILKSIPFKIGDFDNQIGEIIQAEIMSNDQLDNQVSRHQAQGQNQVQYLIIYEQILLIILYAGGISQVEDIYLQIFDSMFFGLVLHSGVQRYNFTKDILINFDNLIQIIICHFQIIHLQYQIFEVKIKNKFYILLQQLFTITHFMINCSIICGCCILYILGIYFKFQIFIVGGLILSLQKVNANLLMIIIPMTTLLKFFII